MEGEAAAATIEVLVQNLINISREEISIIRGLEKEAEKLKKTLAMIQSFLDDAEKKFITENSVKRWLKELEAVAFDVDDVLDELSYRAVSKKIKNIKAEKKKVPSFLRSFNHCARRRQMALRIKEINMTFESIRKNATELGLESRLASAPAALDAGPETDSLTLDPIFIGRDDDVSKIVEMLTRSPTEQALSILPIVGMGGLGKTTLARKVFIHEKIKNHFREHIWVHVSKNFDAVILLRKILANLTSQNVEVASREVLLKKLREALEAKTYLLVLDDIWNQERQRWEDFVNSLSGITSVKGNGVIVTTRNTEVASIVKTLDIHHLNGLSEEDCWSIIKEKAFRGGDAALSFETIGKNIARRCQGLPLAANVIGGVLRDRSEDEWLSIKDDWSRDVEGDENNIFKILKLSFDHLSSPSLKKCFAYCSIFTKGAHIERKELVELWMAEGFLHNDQRNDMEIVGNKFVDILLQNFLLQVVRRDRYANITHCSMHDLVHDLACSVSGSQVNDNISDGNYRVRHLSYGHYGDESSRIPEDRAKYLRTLFLNGEISDIAFSDFKRLHVLSLEDSHAEELPSSIRKLIHLRFLNISYTGIEYLPDSIGELHHLQTLRARTDYLKKLPSTLKYLINLRHLHIPQATESPPELGMLTSLQTLPYFKVGDEKGRWIVELGSLQNLTGELEIQNLEKVHGEEEAKRAHLSQKSNIVKLVLVWGETREGETNDESVLEGLQPHPNLKMLEIIGFKGRSFPPWTLKMAVRLEGCWVELKGLVEIRLWSCEECEEIPTLGHLPHLKFLYLSHLRNVKSIGSSFYGVDGCSSNNGVREETTAVFPALEWLSLSYMPNLTEWLEAETPSAAQNQPREVKAFPRLEYLEIRNCRRLESAPSQFPCLKELNIDNMDSGLPLANICGIKLTSLTKLTIEGSSGLIRLPDWLFRNNRNLSELEIRNCPNLRELPDDLHSLHSLEELTIEMCGNLKSIPYSSQGQARGLTSLRALRIMRCQGLSNLPREMVESCAPSLEELYLAHLSGLLNFPVIFECLHKMPRLRALGMVGVPNFLPSSSPGIGSGSFRSLQELVVGPASRDRVDSFNKAVDGLLQFGCQSLRRLDLNGMGDWGSLPDEIQHLTALSSLCLYNFGIQELPEWFGNLSSLRTLSLNGCGELRRLPSVEAMRRLTKLSHLSVFRTPLLQDSEWPKISHVPDVWADGRPIRLGGRTPDSG